MPLEFLIVLCLGLALLFGVLEIFVPSFGVLTILAILALVASVTFAMKIGPLFGLAFMLFLMLSVPILVGLLLKLAPRTHIGKLIFLETEPEDRTTADPIREEFRALTGQRGRAVSLMLPSGKVSIGGKTYDAVCESGAIDPGGEVYVLRSEAAYLVVRGVTGEDDAHGSELDDSDKTNAMDPQSVQYEDPYVGTEER